MEFFHAKIYWSGYGEIITNVAELPTSDGKKVTDLGGKYAILWVSLTDKDVIGLKGYLENKFDRHIDDDDFEKYMESAFYNGSPVDSWFNLEKFMRVCSQLQISPTMFYYTYERISKLNSR